MSDAPEQTEDAAEPAGATILDVGGWLVIAISIVLGVLADLPTLAMIGILGGVAMRTAAKPIAASSKKKEDTAQ